MIVNGTTYNDSTPPTVANILEAARLSQRSTRLRLYYGDQDTGHDWGEESDTLGYVGRSTGIHPIPILINNTRSMGGPAILDHCIVKIQDTGSGRVLYQHPNYNQPVYTVALPDPDSVDGLPACVRADGQLTARFATLDAARRYVDYMTGKRFNK